jgi:multiple sugar transport system permease protein
MVTRRDHGRAAAAFLAPNFIGFAVFTLFPVVLSLVMAFTNWTLKRNVDIHFVGLRNFTDLLTDGRFWYFFGNTLILMLGIPLTIAGALGLALLLNDSLPLGRSTRWRGAGLCLAGAALSAAVLLAAGHADLALVTATAWLIAALGLAFDMVAFRTIFYLPTFTSGVAIYILWKAIYNPKTGPLNVLLSAFDIEGPAWLGSTFWAKPALILMGVWIGIGGTTMLLYLAALSNIPRDLLDAAAVDGAGPIARFRHVTWPQLLPTTFFVFIISIIGGLQGGFEQARVMTGGGPAGSTTTLSYYIYTTAFLQVELGYAAAISWVLFLIIFIATAINWRYGKDLDV